MWGRLVFFGIWIGAALVTGYKTRSRISKVTAGHRRAISRAKKELRDMTRKSQPGPELGYEDIEEIEDIYRGEKGLEKNPRRKRTLK